MTCTLRERDTSALDGLKDISISRTLTSQVQLRQTSRAQLAATSPT